MGSFRLRDLILPVVVAATVTSLFSTVASAQVPVDFTLSGAEAGALVESQFGSALAIADLNADGFQDLLVVAPLERPNGRIFVFSGAKGGLQTNPAWQFSHSSFKTRHTPAVIRAVGDVNGDGIDDFAFTSESVSLGGTPFNEVAVFHGSRSWPGTKPDTVISNGVSATKYGWAISGAGDVNRDGFDDLLIGSPDESSVAGERQYMDGAVTLHLGSPAGLLSSPAWKRAGGKYNAHIGFSVSGGGDVNRDGYSDIIYGSESYSTGLHVDGSAWIYCGGASGLASAPIWNRFGTENSRTFGSGVLMLDADGNNYSDVIVASHFGSSGQSAEGVVQGFGSGARGVENLASWRAEGNQPEARFGFVLARGDFNGDRRADLVVGAPYATGGFTNSGVVCVYYGSDAGFRGRPQWTSVGAGAYDYFGASVAAGDLNHDGFDDLAVSNHPFSDGSGKTGSVAIFFGTAAGLRDSDGWLPESERYGFDFQTLVVPVPNIAWRTAFFSSLLVGAVWLALVTLRLRTARRELLEQTAARARSEERTRVARDLHDHLGAHLTRIALGCEQALGRVPDNIHANLDRIRQDASEAIQNVSEIVWATNPDHDRLDRLVDYLTENAVKLFGGTGVRLTLDVAAEIQPVPVSSELRHHVFLATREAMNNALKHSGAKMVLLKISMASDQRVEVIIADDGRGEGSLSCGNPMFSSGNGLRNMESRMKLVRGSLEFRSGKGGGMEVIFNFPIVADF